MVASEGLGESEGELPLGGSALIRWRTPATSPIRISIPAGYADRHHGPVSVRGGCGIRRPHEFGIEGHLLGAPPGRVDTTGRMSARKRARRALSHSAFGGYESRVVDLLRQTLARTEGREVDVRQVMTAFTGRSLTDYCLGSDGAGLADALADAVAASEVFMGSSLTMPAWLPIPSVRRLHRADARLRRLLADRIDARRAAPARDEVADLLDVLLTDSSDARDVTTMVEAILRASYGQPGVTLTWAVLTLACRPGLAQRLTTDSGDYAEAFVKELLRMYPPTWLMGREVWEHTTIGDIEVGPGEQIMFCAYLVHRDPRWWHDPEAYAGADGPDGGSCSTYSAESPPRH